MHQVCIILEETYPYVLGGVSKWTHDLICGLPDINFALLHIHTGAQPKDPVFERPSNLTSIVNFPLLINNDQLVLKRLLSRVPQAQIYHALSTGFAGFVATKVKLETGRPFILTEHGIYWHEIELGVDEIECGFKIIRSGQDKIKLGRNWQKWSQTFRQFAYSAYQAADQITTVSNYNQKMQRSLGAEKDKSTVINNGVDIDYYAEIWRARQSQQRPTFGMVARVTPIKDIKTFIKAARLVSSRIKDATFYCIGPTDQDALYYNECLALINELQLSNFIFTHEADPAEYYRKIDVSVLSSVSEGQPLSILESMACGIPVVASDVGCCKELLYRQNGAERFEAGYIFPAGNAQLLASAMIEIAGNKLLRESMSKAGRQLAAKYYNKDKFIESYKEVYMNFLRES